MKVFEFKKIFAAFFLLMFFLTAQNVHAEKTDWADQNFNFKAVKKIVIFDIDSVVNLSSYGSAVQQKVSGDYLEKATKKSKCQVITEGQAQQILGGVSREVLRQNIESIADAWVECRIKNWQDSYYIVPEHTVWEQKRMTRTHRRSDGSSWEETYYITVPVTYPPRRVDVSDISVSLEAFSAKTKQSIFARDDVRGRESAQAQKDMFGRICNSFFEDFGKKVK